MAYDLTLEGRLRELHDGESPKFVQSLAFAEEEGVFIVAQGYTHSLYVVSMETLAPRRIKTD